MLLRIVIAKLDRLHVAVDELRLLGVGLGQQLADMLDIQIEQRRQNSGIADVLHQDARAHAVEVFVAHARQRHADHGYVIARQQRRARPGGVINQVAPGGDLLEVPGVGLGVHRDHDVHAAGACHMAVPGHADLIPGREPLDVGREVVLAHHRDAAAEDGLHQQAVGACRAGAVDRGDLDDEVVDCGRMTCSACFASVTRRARAQAVFGLLACMARDSSRTWGQCTKDFCISHAAVGQRSAHRPQ